MIQKYEYNVKFMLSINIFVKMTKAKHLVALRQCKCKGRTYMWCASHCNDLLMSF